MSPHFAFLHERYLEHGRRVWNELNEHLQKKHDTLFLAPFSHNKRPERIVHPAFQLYASCAMVAPAMFAAVTVTYLSPIVVQVKVAVVARLFWVIWTTGDLSVARQM